MPRMYRGEENQLVAFPMGGIGAGTICLEGTGALSHVSLYHRPDLLHEPNAFAALTIRRPQGNRAVVLQGPVPERKIFRAGAGGRDGSSHRNRAGFRDAGLPEGSDSLQPRQRQDFRGSFRL